MNFDLNTTPSQKGKTAIVTGANIGLGYETALGLARKQAKVIMACRNQEKAETAKLNIEQLVPGADLEIILLDLNSLQSVRHFAEEFGKKHDRLDILINNAGLMVPPLMKTADGFESQFGINHLAHFLLTNLLMPLLKKREGSRIITLSSLAHERGYIDFDNLNAENSYSKMGAYRQSKLACLMFAYELQRRLEQAGSKTIALSAHPGVSITNLVQYFPKHLTFLFPIASIFTHSAEKGALPILMAAMDPNIRGGEYVGPTGFRGMTGKPAVVPSRPHSHDTAVAKKLWQVSETLTGQTFNIS